VEAVAQAESPAQGYERLIGRLSRAVAREFVDWLDSPPQQAWLDVGCGTGALSAAIAERARPARVVGMDPDPGAVDAARQALGDGRLEFRIGSDEQLPEGPAAWDYAVSGLVLNLVPDPARMLGEMMRVVKPGGTVAAYVWDFAGRMQVLRYFWDVAVALDPAAESRDQGRLYPLCRPHRLRALFEDAGLKAVAVRTIEVPAHYSAFADYWQAIETGQGRPSDYVATLDHGQRGRLRDALERHLPQEPGGSIRLTAKAWAIAGHRP
jgi:SAM-dependent methyltransferase